LWNPDAGWRVEEIHHRPDTRMARQGAADASWCFEDAMINVVDHLLRLTGANRAVIDRRRGR